MTDRPGAFRKRFPIQTSNAFIERFADCLRRLQSKQSASCFVEISDPALGIGHDDPFLDGIENRDRKSTRLNSSHLGISYAVFCLKKKKKERSLGPVLT